MNNLQIFENDQFGKVRMIKINNKPYTVGNDVAAALGYSSPTHAVKRHCKGCMTHSLPTSGGIQEMKVVPEGDIYRLIIKAADQSQNEEIKERAERFEKWIFDEVLPEIRKTGQYIDKPNSVEDLIILQAESVKELKQKVDYQEKQINSIKDAVIHTDQDWRNWVNQQLNTIGFRNKNYREVRKQSYDILENRARCRLNVRLNNLKERLEQAGAKKSKVNKVSKLDVIEEDTRLKEIYTSVVEKLVIKYSA
ncbi:MAG: hypothetical protein BHK79_02805 [Halanaerobium sp. MDAL1]|nr:MAG: hypothetical protein BHK79_02805 [Halanaerobium sp. MDAL1]